MEQENKQKLTKEQRKAVLDNYRVMRDIPFLASQIARSLELDVDSVQKIITRYYYITETKELAEKCYLEALDRGELYSASKIKRTFNL